MSDSTVHYDRSVKAPLYARHEIPELWLVNLRKNQLTFFRSLADGKYLDITSTDSPGITPIPGLPGVSVALAKVLNL